MASDGAWTGAPLATAAEYAALGLAVVPDCAPSCKCSHPGKRPWDPSAGRHMSGWERRDVPSSADLEAWLEAPGAQHLNVGCRCGPQCLGPDGLIGGDADGRRGIHDLATHLGLEARDLEVALEEYREAGIFRLGLGSAAYLTQAGGLRVLWRAPAAAKLRTVGGDQGHNGLGLYWQGKQVVLPPSRGRDGDYRWLPGHGPWQTGFGVAPASVLAAMSRTHEPATVPVSVTVLPVPTYPAAVGDLGPHRDGRLVHRVWLPYDLDLLRDGVPEGQRSEAVRRLELQMMHAGWPPSEVVAALVAQPWVRGMEREHGPILRYLFGDVARARAWRAAEAENRDLWAPAGSGPAFARRADGCRLRTFDRGRDEAMRAGVAQIHDFVAALPHPTPSHRRMLAHTERLQGGFERCRSRAWAHHHDLRHESRGTAAGAAWVWSDAPCDGRGHEDCAPYHALRELQRQWGPALAEVYGALPVAVLALSAPGWGLDKTRSAVTHLLGRAETQRALGLCAGFLVFEPGPASGYIFCVVVPAHRTDELRGLLLRAWRRCVPVGWLRRVDDLPEGANALEALVELRVRSEQAILLALGRGEVGREEAVRLYAVETGVFSGGSIGGQRQRLVVAPGMRKLAKDMAAGRRPLALAVGSENSATPHPEGAESAGPGAAGTGSGGTGAFPLIGCVAPFGPSAAGAPGVPAGVQGTGPAVSGVAGAPAGAGHDDGWVPCPWDPALQMRPSRSRKGRPRALPWWTLERMAARGEVEPILHNGRLIGYRERP